LEKIVHKTKATECGRARSDHAMSANWGDVTCAACLAKKPGPPVIQCRSCRRPVLGQCVHWPEPGVWFHVECVNAFERTSEGRALLREMKPAGEQCAACGQAIARHPGGTPCPSVMLGMVKR